MITAAAPPGPRQRFLGGLVAPGRDTLSLLQRCARDYGDITFFRMSGERCFLANDPQLIKDVLVTNQRNFRKSRGLERAKRLLGEGLLTSEGATHLRQRRLLQPAFHRDRIANYGEVMVDHAVRMRERWRDGETYDVAKEMMRVTLGIVGKTLFDSDVDSQADEVGKAVSAVLNTFWLNLLPFPEIIEKLPIPALKRAQLARKRLDQLIYALIADRRASGRDHGDLLSTLLAMEGMDDQQIRDEAMTLILAGHETTANALTWTWYLLSQHPEIEARVHDEVDRVLEGRLPSLADLARLPLIERVVTEAMRLYPPAWIIGRRAIAEYPLGDYLVPPRGIIFMSPYVMQRDARFYDEPERFHPDRWTPEFKAALPKFAYFPFGGGTRACIGEHFAWMELELLVATIAQQWSLRLVPNHPVVPQPLVTLRAKHGMKMIATSRKTPALRA
jgi:cytochrome P450